MGCSTSVFNDVVFDGKRRASVATVSSVDALESDKGHFGTIAKRYGHPTYYKGNGYDIGLRYKIRGCFQSHFIGCSRSTGEKITMKEFHVSFYPSDDATIMNEVLYLSKFNHPSIPKFRELFITEQSIFMVTDYVDQQRLSHCINNLNATETRRIFKQLLSAVQYVHDRKIVLRELTPNNIVVRRLPASADSGGVSLGGGQFDVKIADLSMAVEVGCKDALADHPLFDWSLVPYSAPEVVLSQPYNTAADMWSLGVLLYGMLAHGRMPFEHSVDHVLIKQVTHAMYDFLGPEWEDVSERARSVISSLLKVPGNERITAKEASKHHWLVIGG